jgi:3-methyladenine DNA glycosylase Tag
MAAPMEAPPQITPQRLGDYLEVMSKAVFQSGISWKVVESKWPELREAFREFDAETVAHLSEPEIDALASDRRVIRNRRKIDAIVGNANRLLELDAEHGGFQSYLRSHEDFEATVKDLRKQFKYLGDMGCYYFLYVVGEQVPPHDEWEASRRK